MAVTEFETPCGVLRLTNSAGHPVPFCIRQEILPYRAEIWDDIAQRNVPFTAQDQYTVSIDTAALTPGMVYTLRLCGATHFTYGDSDEYAVANVTTCGSYTLSLGAADPNDAEKDRQAVPVIQGGVRIGLKPPAQYDESKFSRYVLIPLPDWSGYQFRLLDRTEKEIRFRLVWLHHDLPYADPAAYESAVTLWSII